MIFWLNTILKICTKILFSSSVFTASSNNYATYYREYMLVIVKLTIEFPPLVHRGHFWWRYHLLYTSPPSSLSLFNNARSIFNICINQAFSLSTSSNRGDLNNEWMAYIILWNLDGCKNCNATVHTLKKDNQYFTGPKFNRCNILFIGSQYHTKKIMLRIVFYDTFHVIINKRKYSL